MPDGSSAHDELMFGYLERFASVLVAAGIPPMPARVFVALLVADAGRLTAAELAEVLRVSPAAVSGAVRYLTQLGLVHKERVPGSRRDYYRMPDDPWTDMFRLRDQVLQRWAALIREGIDLLGADTRPARGWPSTPCSSSSSPGRCPRSSSAGTSTGRALGPRRRSRRNSLGGISSGVPARRGG